MPVKSTGVETCSALHASERKMRGLPGEPVQGYRSHSAFTALNNVVMVFVVVCVSKERCLAPWLHVKHLLVLEL